MLEALGGSAREARHTVIRCTMVPDVGLPAGLYLLLDALRQHVGHRLRDDTPGGAAAAL